MTRSNICCVATVVAITGTWSNVTTLLLIALYFVTLMTTAVRTHAFVVQPSSSVSVQDVIHHTISDPKAFLNNIESRKTKWNLSLPQRTRDTSLSFAVDDTTTTTASRRIRQRQWSSSSSVIMYASPSSKSSTEERRKVLLSRTGPHFKVDRIRGTIEFGATANLVTQLLSVPPPSQLSKEDTAASTSTTTTTNSRNMIDLWLLDENRGLAMSIWDPKLMTDLGNDIYRLQIMTLQFVTITLAPWVDVQMKPIRTTTTTARTTDNDSNNNNNPSQKPEFIVQSIGFDPNIQILPGMRINGNALGIVIEVAGVLRPGEDGTSVTGAIAFQTSGNLPPPLRLLPDAILKSASDTINTTIVKFAIQSFQKGAKMNFQQFIQQYELKKK